MHSGAPIACDAAGGADQLPGPTSLFAVFTSETMAADAMHIREVVNRVVADNGRDGNPCTSELAMIGRSVTPAIASRFAAIPFPRAFCACSKLQFPKTMLGDGGLISCPSPHNNNRPRYYFK